MSYETVCFTNKIIKPRKPHVCDWCDESIKVGEHCWYNDGRFDGDFYRVFMHKECDWAMRKEMNGEENYGGDYSYDPGQHKRGMTSYETEELNDS